MTLKSLKLLPKNEIGMALLGQGASNMTNSKGKQKADDGPSNSGPAKKAQKVVTSG